jgi:indolepyruvate ferredoxin oxidoreductase beta subunit
MYNILISGVGGQGTLLASRILGELFISAGRDVKLSEVHGMSQRGGSVVTYVRAADMGEKVSSPLIPDGEADVLIAFEELEALRWVGQVRKGGAAAVNTARILPMPVLSGAASYPEDASERLQKSDVKLLMLDALALARQAGDVRAVNVVMLGAVSAHMMFTEEDWKHALERTVSPRFLEMNLKAFSLGRGTQA